MRVSLTIDDEYGFSKTVYTRIDMILFRESYQSIDFCEETDDIITKMICTSPDMKKIILSNRQKLVDILPSILTKLMNDQLTGIDKIRGYPIKENYEPKNER